MSNLTLGSISGMPLNGNVVTVPSGHIIRQTGTIVQVVQVVKTDATAMSPGGIWGTIPGMSATITPRFSTSRIMVMIDVKAIGTTDVAVSRTRLIRDGNPIYVGDAAGSRPRGMSQAYVNGAGAGQHNIAQQGGVFLDSPATVLPITYAVQIGGDGTTNTFYINRTQSDRDTSTHDGRAASSITLMEIAS